MDQQLKYSVVSEVVGSEKIERFKRQISSLPEAGVGLDQVSTKLGGLSLRMGVYGAVALAAYSAVNRGLDEIIAGEKVNAINAQFQTLAASAGIAGEEAGRALIKMTDGLIDDEDALQIATRGIAALGIEAAKLPELMDVARAVSRTLGSDLKVTFGDLASFVENGNTKVLRQYGIVLELSGAYERAAKSIGLTAGELTEAQQQAIRLNYFLEQVPKKFNSSADSVTPLKDALDRLKVSIANTKEEYFAWMAEVDARILVDKTDFSNVGTTRLQKQSSETSQEVERLSRELKILNEERLGARGVSEVTRYALSIDDVSKRLAAAKENASRLMVELSGRSDAELFRALDKSHEAPKPVNIELTEDQKTALQKKKADEKKKYVDELKREADVVDRFRITQEAQLEQERLQIESYKKSTVEIQKERVEIQLRGQAQRDSLNFHEPNRAAMAATTEEIIRQKQALIDQEEQQKRSFGPGAAAAFKKYTEAARDVASQTEQMFSNAFQNMEDMVLDFVKTGTGSFEKFANAVIDDLLRIYIRQVSLGVFSWLGGSGGSGGGAAAAAGGGSNLGLTGTLNPGLNVQGLSGSGKISGLSAGGGSSISVVVQVDANSNPSVAGDPAGNELGLVIGAAVKKEIVVQLQPGGLLNRK